jgi:hypothetical protein
MHDHAVDAAHSMLALQLCELALLAQWLHNHKPKVGITTETAMAWHDHATAAGTLSQSLRTNHITLFELYGNAMRV